MPNSAQLATYRADKTESAAAYLNPLTLVADLWRRRDLIWQFSIREVQGRYKGSHLGVLWALLNPLMMLTVYTFVFHVLYHSRWDRNNPHENFMVYAMHVFIRMIAFNVFSESVNKAPILITSNPNYVKKVVFPLEILPVSLIAAALFHSLLSVLALIIGALSGAGPIHATILLLPLAYIPLILFTAGICWLLASLGVFLRDIGNVVAVAVQLLFFLTPILYPSTLVPGWAATVMRYNPMAMIVDNFGRVVNDGVPPDWTELVIITAASAIVAVAGYAWFMKIKRAFADVI
jgi:lipopolysaccharide transport system permease protein